MQLQSETVLFNGRFVLREDVFVDIEDRGYQFGDGIYEVIRVYDGQPFLLDEHLVRLRRSAREMQLRLPAWCAELGSRLKELISVTGCQDGIIYVQVSRGVAERMHGFPTASTPPQLIAYTRTLERPTEQQKEGVKAISSADIRWLRCDIKSINLLGNVLAKEEASQHGAEEAILHRDNVVTEGSASNVFIVRDNVLYTHPPTHLILNGITRENVLELARKRGIQVREESFSIQQLLAADEVFITSTTKEIVPVIQVDETSIGTGTVGPIASQLLPAYHAEVQAACSTDV